MKIDKVYYWLELCDDDLPVAKLLLASKNFLHMGFFCHLIAEKALKAIIAHSSDDIPPKIHDLRKLAIVGDIEKDLSKQQTDLLRKLNPLNIEARYPQHKSKLAATLNMKVCNQLMSETEEFLCWIKKRLGK